MFSGFGLVGVFGVDNPDAATKQKAQDAIAKLTDDNNPIVKEAIRRSKESLTRKRITFAAKDEKLIRSEVLCAVLIYIIICNSGTSLCTLGRFAPL